MKFSLPIWFCPTVVINRREMEHSVSGLMHPQYPKPDIQHLVERLEGYQRDHDALFARVIAAIEHDFVPVIVLHAISGLAKITSDNELFADPVALAMLVDVLNERGYRTTATVELREVPSRVDPVTHYIICTKKPRYRFELRFQGSQIRRGV